MPTPRGNSRLRRQPANSKPTNSRTTVASNTASLSSRRLETLVSKLWRIGSGLRIRNAAVAAPLVHVAVFHPEGLVGVVRREGQDHLAIVAVHPANRNRPG